MKIFLSYKWGNEAQVNVLDEDFKAIGLQLTRDVRDIPYKGSLPHYMNQITKSDYALLYISNDYLLSENCMYEAASLMKLPDFEQRVLPVLDEESRLFDNDCAIELLAHWDQELQLLNQKYRGLPTHLIATTVTERLQKYHFIRDNIDEFIRRIVSMKCVKFKEAKSNGYREILDHIGYSNTVAVSEVLEMLDIDSPEKQLVQLRRLRKKYPDLIEIDLIESQIHLSMGAGELSLSILEDRLKELPTSHLLHNSYGNVLLAYKNDSTQARQEYLKALELRPDFGEGYYNLGLLHQYLGEVDDARTNYQRALELKPNTFNILNNYSLLLLNNPRNEEDLLLARDLLEGAVGDDEDEMIFLRINYASILSKLGEYQQALEVLENVIDLRPDNYLARNNLAILLSEHFKDIDEAIRQLLIAIELGPWDSRLHAFVGRLFATQKQAEHARKHLEVAIQLEPSDAQARIVLFSVLMKDLNLEEARQHYEVATKLDPSYIKAGYDKLFEIKRD